MYPKTYFETHKPDPKGGHAFVLMPFAEAFRQIYDTIQQTLGGDQVNLHCTRADELFGGGHIIEDILRCLGEAEIVIADVTGKNPNVFYELGIAHMVKDVDKVLILTQTMEDIPFDLRPFRCITYEHSQVGLRQLQTALLQHVKHISSGSYKFSANDNAQYVFPQKLFGPDRCFHDFELTDVWIGPSAAKFYLKEYRHIIRQPVETVREDSYGINCGESVDLEGIPWRLVLEETVGNVGHFRVVSDVKKQAAKADMEEGKAQDKDTVKIEGEYRSNDSRQYRIKIIPLSDNYYRIENPEWEGVGIFDGDLYYGVYRVSDDAEDSIRGRWGAHRAKFVKEDNNFELFGIELNETQIVGEFNPDTAWIKTANKK